MNKKLLKTKVLLMEKSGAASANLRVADAFPESALQRKTLCLLEGMWGQGRYTWEYVKMLIEWQYIEKLVFLYKSIH